MSTEYQPRHRLPLKPHVRPGFKLNLPNVRGQMAHVTTFPVVPRTGALWCHEAEHSSPAAPSGGWSSLRHLGTNAPVTVRASQPGSHLPGGTAGMAPVSQPAQGTLLACKVGGGEEWPKTSGEAGAVQQQLLSQVTGSWQWVL